jgi:hypothetical protein
VGMTPEQTLRGHTSPIAALALGSAGGSAVSASDPGPAGGGGRVLVHAVAPSFNRRDNGTGVVG